MIQPHPRPRFHLTAPRNWVNDPNGPVYWEGRYHLFYQHNPHRPVWGDIHWGHASSSDLLTWIDHGIALAPSPGPDVDGCWSGCAVPVGDRVEFFYTGLLRVDSSSHQSVCLAFGRGDLTRLEKSSQNPVVDTAVREAGHRHYRDPFVFFDEERGHWLMLLGSGIDHTDGSRAGCVVAYTSRDRMRWSHAGVVLTLPEGSLEFETGPIWECPLLLRYGDTWVLIVSVQLPMPAERAGAAVRCPYALWFVGDFDGARFDPRSSGILDAGGVFYAPATMGAPDGRKLMWGWIQEIAAQDELDAAGFAGALSMPREVEVREGRVAVRPARELAALWGDAVGRVSDKALQAGAPPIPVAAVNGPGRVHIELDANDAVAGIAIEELGGERLAIALDGRGARTRLVVLDALNEQAAATLATTPAERTSLDIYLDHTIIEIFASTGESMTLRRPAPGAATEVRLECWAGAAHLHDAHASHLREA